MYSVLTKETKEYYLVEGKIPDADGEQDYVEIHYNADFAFGRVCGKWIKFGSNGVFRIPPNAEDVYFITDVKQNGPPGHFEEDILYGAAAALVQDMPDVAREIVKGLGDVYVYNLISNSWTELEYEHTASRIAEIASSADLRYALGKEEIIPLDTDAYCLINLIDDLVSDKDALIYPGSLNYQRIGPSSKQEEGYPEFHTTPDVACPIDDLVWNESRLNLSVRVRVPGFIILPSDLVALGLPEQYHTFRYKNYTLIKDGQLNATEMAVLVSDRMKEYLKTRLAEIHELPDGRLLIALESIPIVNRDVASREMSARDLCALTMEITRIKGELKVLNFALKELEPVMPVDDRGLTGEQKQALAEIGVKLHGYSPPTVTEYAGRVYRAPTFKVKITGYGSFPSVNAVTRRLAEGREQTRAGSIMLRKLRWLTGKTSDDIKQEILSLKDRKRRLRDQINRGMFGMLLSKRWFCDIPRQDVTDLVIDGIHYTIEIKRKEFKL